MHLYIDKELCPYVSSCGYLKYSRMLVACGIGLQKLCMHSWGVVNSLVWYIISAVVALDCLAYRGREQAPKDLWHVYMAALTRG